MTGRVIGDQKRINLKLTSEKDAQAENGELGQRWPWRRIGNKQHVAGPLGWDSGKEYSPWARVPLSPTPTLQQGIWSLSAPLINV